MEGGPALPPFRPPVPWAAGFFGGRGSWMVNSPTSSTWMRGCWSSGSGLGGWRRSPWIPWVPVPWMWWSARGAD